MAWLASVAAGGERVVPDEVAEESAGGENVGEMADRALLSGTVDRARTAATYGGHMAPPLPGPLAHMALLVGHCSNGAVAAAVFGEDYGVPAGR